MQNEEKLLSIDDAYDVVVDFLENLYLRTKSEDIVNIVSGMTLLANGRSVDPAMIGDWINAVEKTLAQNFERCGKKLTIKQAYEAMIIFLRTYSYFDEIVDLVDKSRLTNREINKSQETWNDWMKSAGKILDQYPRVRPLFFGISTKILTIDDAFDTMVDWLSRYYNKIKTEDIKILLDKSHDKSQFCNIWNQAVKCVLKNESIENGLSVEEAYEAAAIFLEMYNHDINSNAVTNLRSGMKLLNKLESTDPFVWHSWLESVNKTLNKYRKF